MPSRYQPRGRVRHDAKGRPGDVSAKLGGVHGLELLTRGRAAAVAAGRHRREDVVAMLQRPLTEGCANMARLHRRTVELIDAGYTGGHGLLGSRSSTQTRGHRPISATSHSV